MAIYLNEGQAGWDSHVIGFPHLLVCHGVVLQTGGNLYGFHFDTLADTASYADGFRTFITDMRGDPAAGVRLYGCCNHAARYGTGGEAAWRAEMRLIAGRIGYQGPACGFDTAIIAPLRGTYVEYRRQHGTQRCRIFYKRDERMHHVAAPNGDPLSGLGTGQGKLRTWRPTDTVRQGGWMMNYNITGSTGLDANAHTLHEVNYFLRLTTFTI